MLKEIVLSAALSLMALPAMAAPAAHAGSGTFVIADGDTSSAMQFAIDFAATQGSIQEIDDADNSTLDGAGPDGAKVDDQGGGSWEIDNDNNETLAKISDQGGGSWEIDDPNNETIGYIKFGS